MATFSANYSTVATVTFDLKGLGNGSWRASTAVDNSSNLYLDAQVGGIVRVHASVAPTNGGTIDIYAYGSYDGTNYTAGASGTDGAYTADGEEGLFKLLETIVVDTSTNVDYVWGPVSVAAAFGGFLPNKWGLAAENNTGQALDTTGTNNETQFFGVKITSA